MSTLLYFNKYSSFLKKTLKKKQQGKSRFGFGSQNWQYRSVGSGLKRRKCRPGSGLSFRPSAELLEEEDERIEVGEVFKLLYHSVCYSYCNINSDLAK